MREKKKNKKLVRVEVSYAEKVKMLRTKYNINEPISISLNFFYIKT